MQRAEIQPILPNKVLMQTMILMNRPNCFRGMIVYVEDESDV